MLRSIRLHRVGPAPRLSATFGERLNVVTGDNGLGKSFLLDVCFWALTGTWPGGRTALPEPTTKSISPTITYELKGKTAQSKSPKIAAFDFHSQTWTRPKGRPFIPGLVVYAAVDGSFAVWDPARNYWRDPSSGLVEGEEQPRAYQFTPGTLANGLKEGERILCNGLVQDWVNWQYQRPQGPLLGQVRPTSAGQPYHPSSSHRRSRGPLGSPFELLGSVVRALSHPEEPMEPGAPWRVFVDDTRTFPTIDVHYGTVAFPHWAAGIKRVLGLAYLLVWSWTEHVQAAKLRNEDPENRLILIVDEIEAHLHPKWQRTILPALLHVVQKLQAQVEVQVFAATHSPLVLASLEPHFEQDQDKLFWFDLDGQTVHFRDYTWTNHGDVVGWLTSEIFGLQQARSREAEDAILAAKAFLKGDHDGLPTGLRSKQQIEKRLRVLLGGQDPFLVRWHVSTESNDR
jgi:hypothetical protein